MKKILIGHLSIFKLAKSILSSDGKLITNGNVLNQIDVSTFETGLYNLILELQNAKTINTNLINSKPMRTIFKKSATLLIVTILTAGLFSSCKKDEETTTTTYNVEGLWTGTYNVKGDVGIGNQPFTLTIKKDSSVLVETKFFNEYQIAKGTWSLTGDKFICTYTYIYGAGAGTNTIQSASATFNKNSGTFTNATWVNVNPATGQNGALVLTKVN